ncbi:glutamate racemase [bacterium BMS3Abin04]|nr:glutamate racemase [bacterium BMS3Abin04]
MIQEVVGDKVELIDSGTAASYVVRDYLKGRGLLNKSNSIGFGEFYVSDLPKRFKEVAERFLGRSLEHVHKIDLDSIHNL